MLVLFNIQIIIGILVIIGIFGFVGLWLFNNLRRWDFFKDYKRRKRKV